MKGNKMKLSIKAGYIAVGVALVAVIGLAAMAASGGDDDTDNPGVAGTCLVGTSECNDTPGLGEDPGLDISTGVEVHEIDGVTVFSHDPEAWNDALHTGEASIVDGCLIVGNAVVVWHTDSIDQASDAIDAVKRGESTSMTLGGGGSSLEEGGTIPTFISDHCTASEVWFASP